MQRGRLHAFYSSPAYAGAGAAGAPLTLDVFQSALGRGCLRAAIAHPPLPSAAAANLTANGSKTYAWLGYAMAAEPGVVLPATVWRASLAPALEQADVAKVGVSAGRGH